jgi:hypoxanthine phosphoribosyltransferase
MSMETLYPKASELPEGSYQILTHPEVLQRIDLIAVEIVRDYHDKNPLLISVSEGADFFAHHLEPAIKAVSPGFNYELAHLTASRTTTEGGVRVPVITDDIHEGISIENRVVGVLEDIADQGETLRMLDSHLLSKQPAEIFYAALFSRFLDPDTRIPVKYVGYDIHSDMWGLGSGLDYRQQWRYIDGLWLMPPQLG